MNQCDGCKRGMPLHGKIHINNNDGGKWDMIVCTKERYKMTTTIHSEHMVVGCPKCGSADIQQNDSPSIGSNKAWQSMTCCHCDAQWNEMFKYIGFEMEDR